MQSILDMPIQMWNTENEKVRYLHHTVNVFYVSFFRRPPEEPPPPTAPSAEKLSLAVIFPNNVSMSMADLNTHNIRILRAHARPLHSTLKVTKFYD